MFSVFNRHTNEEVTGPLTAEQLRDWLLVKIREERSLAKYVYRKQS